MHHRTGKQINNKTAESRERGCRGAVKQQNIVSTQTHTHTQHNTLAVPQLTIVATSKCRTIRQNESNCPIFGVGSFDSYSGAFYFYLHCEASCIDQSLLPITLAAANKSREIHLKFLIQSTDPPPVERQRQRVNENENRPSAVCTHTLHRDLLLLCNFIKLKSEKIYTMCTHR